MAKSLLCDWSRIEVGARHSADLDRISRSIDALVNRAGLTTADAERVVRDLLSQRNFYILSSPHTNGLTGTTFDFALKSH